MTMAELGGEHLKGFDKVSAHVCNAGDKIRCAQRKSCRERHTLNILTEALVSTHLALEAFCHSLFAPCPV